MIRIEDLHAGYGEREVLHGVSLTLAPGEMVGPVREGDFGSRRGRQSTGLGGRNFKGGVTEQGHGNAAGMRALAGGHGEIGWAGIEYQVYNFRIRQFPRSFCR